MPTGKRKRKKRYVPLAVENCWKVDICEGLQILNFRKGSCSNLSKKLVQIQLYPVLLKSIKLDKAKCFKSRSFGNFLEEQGIKTEIVTPYLHTVSGGVERTAQTLQELGRGVSETG